MRFVFSKEDEEDEDESVKIMLLPVFRTLCDKISYNFLHAVTF